MYNFSSIARLGATATICLITTNASAELVFASEKLESSAFASIQVVQSQNDLLSDSDLRRINHYSDQALSSLREFASPNSDAGFDGQIDALRNKIKRLIDAGKRSGLSLNQTASFFGDYLEVNNFRIVPPTLQNASGALDTLDLFSSVNTYFAIQQPEAIDMDAYNAQDMEGIRQAVNDTPPETIIPVQTNQIEAAPAPVQQLSKPEIPSDANNAARAIYERIDIRDGQWFITVERGDSLGQFAAALYGDTLNFGRIFDKNLDVIRTPNILDIGITLVLPQP